MYKAKKSSLNCCRPQQQAVLGGCVPHGLLLPLAVPGRGRGGARWGVSLGRG